MMNYRRKKGAITKLKLEKGETTCDSKVIEETLINFFHNLYTKMKGVDGPLKG